MSERYYYDCPIKAAYMAKYYGIKFQYSHKVRHKVDLGHTKAWAVRNEIATVSNPHKIITSIAGLSSRLKRKYYVHEDSLKLLELVDSRNPFIEPILEPTN